MQFKCQFYANFWLNSYVTLSGNYLTMMHNKILLSKSVVEYLISKLLRNKDNFLYETLISWKTDPFLLMKTTLKKPWRSEEVYRRRWNVRGEVCCDKALEYDKAFMRDFRICWLFVKCQEKLLKIWISREREKLFRWNKKHFSQFLKGYNLVKK